MIDGNMGEFESQINYYNLVENSWLEACVFETTYDIALI
jgi:hypothetical protein